MPASRSLENTIWASDLVGADVVSSRGSVARVTGLVVSPLRRVLALRVQLCVVDESPRNKDEHLLLFDAALGYAPGRVSILSGDDVVSASQVPSLANLAAPSPPFLGTPVRTVMGASVGYLWDALVHPVSGELVQYRIGNTPQPTEEGTSVLTSCRLCACLQGELTVQEDEAGFLRDLLGRVPRSA